MNGGNDFADYLATLNISDDDRRVHLLAILSASIALCSPEFIRIALQHLSRIGIPKEAVYETILQSYLFLGFPRMIEAALIYNEIHGNFQSEENISPITSEESDAWFTDGQKLCMQVYGKNYDMLKAKFMAVSPEMFRWMVLEGYGKVLTRPGLTQIERELAEVAALIIDGRERQLVSHIKGSLNVGAGIKLIREINDDIRPLAGDDRYKMTLRIISEIEEKYETTK